MTPALAGQLELDSPPRTKWQIAFATYRKSWRNVIAFGFIALIGLIAIFVPFIANGMPYTGQMTAYTTPAGAKVVDAGAYLLARSAITDDLRLGQPTATILENLWEWLVEP